MLTEVDQARLAELLQDPLTRKDGTIVWLCETLIGMNEHLAAIRAVVNASPARTGGKEKEMTHQTIWNPTLDAQLEQYRRDGLTYRQIAERMGITTNMVVGRAHRMGLPLAMEIDAMPDVIVASMIAAFPDRGLCLFPHGDPRKPDYGYCCDPIARVGLPYCAAHMREAYWVLAGEKIPKKDATR